MAARKVLGNDPFKRKAAVRTPVAGPPPPGAKGKTRRPTTPELQEALRTTRGAPSGSGSAPAEGHSNAPEPRFEPIAHDASPRPTHLSPADEPRPHAHSPSIGADPVPHGGSPELPPEPRPHRDSPSIAGDPTPHLSSPTATANALPDPADQVPAPAASPALEPRSPSPPPSFRAVPAIAAQVAPASLGGAVRGLLDAARSLWRRQERPAPLDAWGKDAELARTLRPLAELLYERYWRVQTTGIENVPSGPCILVANHAGALPLDGPVLHLALRRERPELRESRWLLEEQALAAPFFGRLANRLGAVRSTPENAQRLLAEGRPLIIFPEGAHGPGKPFGERYQLRRFGRGGYLKVALREGVPVVPVAIVGSEESSPVLARLPLKRLGFDELPLSLPPLPARWLLRFGPCVDLQGRPTDPDGDPLWVEEKNLEVREQIAAMITELLALRPRVF